ncbi:putative phage terminase [Serratia fonticola AU-P3(3)]|nr:putative phage terminase [Serratia fonticola AU-P3(3)]
MGISPTLNVPQARFIALNTKFKAYVAGFGSGKTWVGCGSICKGFWEFPKVNQGYFAPTYPQIRDIFYPTVEEVAHDWGLNVKINESNKEVHFYEGRAYRGTTICRSMEKPETIVGFKIGNALVDELDVMKAVKAQQAWRKIIARMRYKRDGLRNGIDVTTTPEGFKFVYQQFVKAVREKPELATLYGLVQASTFDNAKNLPHDYISSLLSSYPTELIKAYLNGQFVNLASGTVYNQFDRILNNCVDEEQPGEPLFIGMDFNVGKMAGIIHVKRDGLPRAVCEITNAYDTPDMIKRIQRQFWKETTENIFEKTREIYIYPDASGDSRKSVDASKTDLSQLSDAGFEVRVNLSNPPVKDRINSVNAMFCNAIGERRYRVNVQRCPTYTENLEQQVWADNGEPDKKAGNDHTNDAGGYFIVKDYPIIKPAGAIFF